MLLSQLDTRRRCVEWRESYFIRCKLFPVKYVSTYSRFHDTSLVYICQVKPSCWYICPQMHSFSGIFWKFEVHLGQFGTEIWFSEVLLNDCFSCWAVRGLEITGINSPPPSAPERKFLFPLKYWSTTTHQSSDWNRCCKYPQCCLRLSCVLKQCQRAES